MSNIKISVNTIHLFEGNEEVVSYKALAQFQEKKDYHEIKYSDPAIDDKESYVMLKYNENELRIIREGSIKSEMVFQPRGSSFGTYEYHGFNLDMKPVLRDFSIEDNLIKVNYDLIINNQNTGNFDVEINILQSLDY